MNDKTQSQVQALAKYAARANFDDLSAESRERQRITMLKRKQVSKTNNK